MYISEVKHQYMSNINHMIEQIKNILFLSVKNWKHLKKSPLGAHLWTV